MLSQGPLRPYVFKSCYIETNVPLNMDRLQIKMSAEITKDFNGQNDNKTSFLVKKMLEKSVMFSANCEELYLPLIFGVLL